MLALSRYDSTIEELRLAARLPDSRFPLSYNMEPPAAILLPHLAGLKRASQVLQLRAIAELQNGQSDQALADVKLMLRLGDSIHTEPFLISQLVSIAIVNIALQPVWEGLAAHQWSDAQLRNLTRNWQNWIFFPITRLAMRGELMLCEIGDIEYLRHYPEQTPGLSGDGVGGSSPRIRGESCGEQFPTAGFTRMSCAVPARCWNIICRWLMSINAWSGRKPFSARRQPLNAEVKQANLFNLAERLFLPALGGAVKRFASGQSSVDLARVAIALERYRLAHGEYPESLDALAPQFMGKIPHDIINGQPLHYRRASDGQFVLYSVGWNEIDDGGMVVLYEGSSSRVDISKGDWVWRSSAVKN